MTDDVLKELWAIKDNIAKEHDYKIDQLAKFFCKSNLLKTRKINTSKKKQGRLLSMALGNKKLGKRKIEVCTIHSMEATSLFDSKAIGYKF